MTPYTLLGCLGTVVVGGGVATACGFAFKSTSNNNDLDVFAPPNN